MLYLNDHIDNIDIAQSLQLVSCQRRHKTLRYRHDLDRRLSLAVYLLLQEALRTEYGIMEAPEFVFGAHGKPALKAHPEIHFNMSHCSMAALCVTGDNPVGCDVETVPDELDMDVCRYCFSETEIRHILSSSNPPLAFTKLWTCKEALLKLTGEGITDNLPTLLSSPEAQRVTFHTIVAPDGRYAYTVCSLGDN